MKKILHLITSLGMGGAEMMLVNLLEQPVIAGETSQVISLTGIGVAGQRIQELGVPVTNLRMQPGQPEVRGLRELVQLLRQNTPDLIQTWMYHADLLGGLAARMAGNIPVAWGLHHTLAGEQPVRPSTMRVIRVNAILSKWLPRRVVCCAESVRQAHIEAGYFAEKMVVISNGIDLEKFQPDPQARVSLRSELGLAPDTRLIGLFARFHPQKDHQTFVKAAGRLHAHLPDVHFVLAGEGVTAANINLQGWLDDSGVTEHVHLLGLRQDMPRLMAGVDVACLTSAYGEALPLAIMESMACGIPCVVTDVGDARLLVGTAGRVVPPRDATAIAEGWEGLLRLPPPQRIQIGQEARERIHKGYNVLHSAQEYASLYGSLIA